ncbi:hypothetical protein B0A48_13114 [Cryoendolithus antarcticus]|uniref:Vacuolar ATPase assembly protein VMA22 n=1 Tax=Cryoendolithus antarcticus TaxID=1507870 RepID=A0A1V8SNH8_9PEZI|nr:hypothetical protein B0A48_13114 [Cryoendolithus antarcticus]
MTSLSEDEQTLLERLDHCWTLYLTLLDNYTAAQRQIQDHCSHGFLALARANARAPPGRRYGQDWYDGRMKATCRVSIEDGKTHPNSDTTIILPKIAIRSHRSSKIDGASAKAQNGSSGNDERTSSQHLPTPPSTPREEEIPPASIDSPGTGKTSDTTSGDPLRWYGILTAPDLRHAQAAFTKLIGECTETDADADHDGLNDAFPLPNAISMAATTSRGLRELEMEIRRLRKFVQRMRKSHPVTRGAHTPQSSSRNVNNTHDSIKSGSGQVDYGALYESDRHFDLFQAKQVGYWLNAYMSATIDSGCVLESSWTAFTALDAHGWVEQRANNKTEITVSDPVKAFFNTVKSALGLQDRVEDIANANWQHSQTKTVSGITYQATNGYYDQAYSRSMIMVMNLDSPMEAGSKQSPPLGDSRHPIVKLRIWSDITFLTYKKYCEDHSFVVADLQAVAHRFVAKLQTIKILEALLGQDKPSLEHAKVLYGEDLAALIATPSGQGSVWLLTQHKAALGKRGITTARVWYQNGWQVVFLFGQPTFPSQLLHRDSLSAQRLPHSLLDGSVASGDLEVPALVPRRTGDDADVRLQHGDTVGQRLPPRIDLAYFPDAQYARFVAKGKSLNGALQSADNCLPDTTFTKLSQLQDWGWENPLRKQVNQDVQDKTRDNVFRSAHVQASQKKTDNFWAVDEHITEKDKGMTTYYPSGAVYSNQYNSRLIIAVANFGPAEKGHLMTPPVTGDPNPYPWLSHWSDVVFLEFQDFMKKNGKDMRDLQGLWQKGIINQDTVNLISRVCGNVRRKDVPQWPGRAYLLGQHREVLGHRYFTNVTVFYDGDPHLLWSIGTLQDGDAKRKREVPRAIPQQVQSLAVLPRASLDPWESTAEDLVKEAKESGIYLSSIQNKDEPELDQCSFNQSRFLNVSALQQYGWVLGEDGRPRKTTYQSIISAAKSLGLVNLGNAYKSRHSMQSQEGASTFWPTGAVYTSFIMRGIIGAVNNKSPMHEGPKKIPPIDGKKDPFPPLSSWSDVAFLQYQNYCKGDPGCMHDLQGVVRDTVINTYTDKVAGLLFGPRGPGKWPGTICNPGDDNFNIFMGVPNGKGVTYLLHRKQFNWKVVDRIHVFSKGGTDLNIFYHISDHGASSPHTPRFDSHTSDILELIDAPGAQDGVEAKVEAWSAGSGVETLLRKMQRVIGKVVGRCGPEGECSRQ